MALVVAAAAPSIVGLCALIPRGSGAVPADRPGSFFGFADNSAVPLCEAGGSLRVGVGRRPLGPYRQSASSGAAGVAKALRALGQREGGAAGLLRVAAAEEFG